MAAFAPVAETPDTAEGGGADGGADGAPQDLDAEAATVLARWIVATEVRGSPLTAAGSPWRRVLSRSWWQRRRAARQDSL